MAATSRSTPAEQIEVGDRTVRLSSPDRVYFSERGETKRDLVDYYLAVGPGIVNAL
ncbi:MAG: ATP-dependent DNA ligase, partial [Terracoccus sp.]